MLRLTKLFSLLFLIVLITFGEELKKQLTVRVKVREFIKVEKPQFLPPDKLSYRIKGYEEVHPNIGKLLEPPKDFEEAQLYVPKEGGCGAPKDLVLYRKGVVEYLRGNLYRAETPLKDLLAIPNSPYSRSANYILGLIYYKRGLKEEALSFFERGCKSFHQYKQPSCESFYALYFQLNKKPYMTEEPLLWKYAYLIRNGEIPEKELNCSNYTFKKYCKYINDFIKGRINPDYQESTEIRKAVLLVEEGKYREAQKILKKYRHKFKPYRDIIIYYLAYIDLKEKKYEDALEELLLLETLNEDLSKSLYLKLAIENPKYVDLVYRKTKEKWLLEYAGILAYNNKNYREAIRYLTKAGKYLFASYAAIYLGDYELAYELLKKEKKKDRLFYRTYLEVLYKLNKEDELLQALEEIKDKYPELYKEYYGWYLFKKKKWNEAVAYFENPYYKAIALFNAGRYEEVLKVLKGMNDYSSRILKAKSAIALGKGYLARKYLLNETPEEMFLTGLSYFIDEEYEKAIPYFEKLIKDKQYSRRALLKLADSYYNLGQKDRAKAIYMLIVKKYPNTKEAKEALIALAQIEAESPTKDIEKIVNKFAKAYPDSPLVPELYFQLANVYISEGKNKKAEAILRKLVNNKEYRERALLLLAKITDNEKEKEKILLNLLNSEDENVRKEAFTEMVIFYEKSGKLEKLAKLLEKGTLKEKIKAIELYLKLGKVKKAERLFLQVYSENKYLEEVKEVALKLYDKTKKVKYLLIAYRSRNPEVSLLAAYKLGNYYLGKNNKKALEYFLEIVYTENKDLPFYKNAVFKAVEILRKMRAKRDASCILEKLEGVKLQPWEEEKVLQLKKILPKCEG